MLLLARTREKDTLSLVLWFEGFGQRDLDVPTCWLPLYRIPAKAFSCRGWPGGCGGVPVSAQLQHAVHRLHEQSVQHMAEDQGDDLGMPSPGRPCSIGLEVQGWLNNGVTGTLAVITTTYVQLPMDLQVDLDLRSS